MRVKAFAAGLGVALSLMLGFPVTASAQIETRTVCWDNFELPGGNWDWSDSVPFGTVPREQDFTADGLVLDLSAARQTSPSNQGKSSAYVAVTSVALSSVNNTDALITYVGTPTPGFQLRAHAQGDAVWNGHLVRENGSDKWWATRPQDWPLVTNASMMNGGATLADYKAAYPLATVSHVGYSLGSGVTTVGTLKSLTFQGVHWTFGLCPLPTTSSTTSTPDTSTSTSDPTSSESSATDTATTTPEATDTTTDTTSLVATAVTTTSKKPAIVNVDNNTADLASTGTNGNAVGIIAGIGLLMLLVGGLTLAVVKLRRTQ